MNVENGAGRFSRIEAKLDSLIDVVAEFRVDTVARLTRLETQGDVQARQEAKQVSAGSYSWMKVGIGLSFVVGALSLVLRLAGL